jgi:hypothetical protein
LGQELLKLDIKLMEDILSWPPTILAPIHPKLKHIRPRIMAGHIQIELTPRDLAKVDLRRHHAFANKPSDLLRISPSLLPQNCHEADAPAERVI